MYVPWWQDTTSTGTCTYSFITYDTWYYKGCRVEPLMNNCNDLHMILLYVEAVTTGLVSLLEGIILCTADVLNIVKAMIVKVEYISMCAHNGIADRQYNSATVVVHC